MKTGYREKYRRQAVHIIVAEGNIKQIPPLVTITLKNPSGKSHIGDHLILSEGSPTSGFLSALEQIAVSLVEASLK